MRDVVDRQVLLVHVDVHVLQPEKDCEEAQEVDLGKNPPNCIQKVLDLDGPARRLLSFMLAGKRQNRKHDCKDGLYRPAINQRQRKSGQVLPMRFVRIPYDNQSRQRSDQVNSVLDFVRAF